MAIVKKVMIPTDDEIETLTAEAQYAVQDACKSIRLLERTLLKGMSVAEGNDVQCAL